jgi:hypothetical protein
MKGLVRRRDSGPPDVSARFLECEHAIAQVRLTGLQLIRHASRQTAELNGPKKRFLILENWFWPANEQVFATLSE